MLIKFSRKRSEARRHRRLWIIAMAATMLSGAAYPTEPTQVQAALTELATEIKASYPSVTHLNLAQARARLGDAVFVDVRDAEEFEVSRIPGAIHIADPETLTRYAESSGKPLVLYCSVGYRSAEMAKHLQNAGVTAVENFTGSIFAWANAGLPLENAHGAARAVHPYGWFWGWRYLEETITRSEVPERSGSGGRAER